MTPATPVREDERAMPPPQCPDCGRFVGWCDPGDALHVLMRKYGMHPGYWCEFGSGWLPIVDRLLADLQALGWRGNLLSAKEKWGCYDAQTDVLARRGWVRFADLRSDDDLATLSPGGDLVYQRPTRLVGVHYAGPMYRLRTRGVDLLVTPNHRLYVARGSVCGGGYAGNTRAFPFEFTDPARYFGSNKRFQKGARWCGVGQDVFVLPGLSRTRPGTSRLGRPFTRVYRWPDRVIPMDDWLVFLGWHVAEGCVDSRGVRIDIACNNTDGGVERERIERAMRTVGLVPRAYGFDRSALHVVASDIQVGLWLREHCGVLAPNKRVPHFVKGLSPRQIRLFLDALYAGDGHQAPTALTLSTTSPTLADDVQELLLKVGGASRLWNRGVCESSGKNGGLVIRGKHDAYQVRWLKRSYFHNTAAKGMACASREEWVPYEGMVYCATVPNGTLYVRRNGIPVWCGNSLDMDLVCAWPHAPECHWVRPYPTGGDGEHVDPDDLPEDYFDCTCGADAAAGTWYEQHKDAYLARERQAVAESHVTCEQCGEVGVMRIAGGWLFVACDAHAWPNSAVYDPNRHKVW